MPPKTKTKDNPNVSDRAFQRIVERETASETLAQREETAFQDVVDNNFSPEEKDRLDQIAQRESAPSWRTNLGRGTGGTSVGQAIMQRLGSKALKRWGIGAAIAAIIGLFGGGGFISLQIAHINDMWNGKAFKIMGRSQFVRVGEYRKTKYFSNPDDCQGGKVRCRFHQGVSDNEISRLRQVGLNPEVGISSTGRSYIKSLTFTDLDGTAIKVDTPEKFTQYWHASPRFVQSLDSVASSVSVLTQGKSTLRYVVRKLSLNLHNPMGTNPPDEKTALIETRRTIYGDDNTDLRPTGMGELDDQLQEEARDIREKLEASNFNEPPITTPSLGDIDIDSDTALRMAQAAGESAVGGMAKRVTMGAGGAVDGACTGYNAVRAADVLAKVIKHRALIKFAMLFMTIGSKMKAGAASSAEVGLLLNAAMTPSVKPDSKGKNFFRSEGWHLMSEGKVRDHKGLVRWTTGGSLAGGIATFRQTIQGVARSVGLNLKRDCGAVKSIWGQGLLIVTGLVLTASTLGAGVIVGLVGAAAVSATLAVLMQFIVPVLKTYLANTIAPDLTDPEGGYGIGNATAAGFMAYQAETGKANGLRPMTASEYSGAVTAAVEHENFLARANAGKNPFSFDNPNSVTSKLLAALLPYSTSPTQAVQGGLLAALSPFGMFNAATTPSLMASPVYAAENDPYGMQYCKDPDILAMGLATDAFCNTLYWENDSTLTNPKYAPDHVTDWIVNNGHIDSQTAAPLSQYFKNFMADCVIDETPLLEDGGGGNIEQTTNSAGGTINTAQCRSTGERETYFRAFLQDTGLHEADNQGANGTFGKEGSI